MGALRQRAPLARHAPLIARCRSKVLGRAMKASTLHPNGRNDGSPLATLGEPERLEGVACTSKPELPTARCRTVAPWSIPLHHGVAFFESACALSRPVLND
jgi:hypothetical protein